MPIMAALNAIGDCSLPVDNLVENSVRSLFFGDARTGAARVEIFEKTINFNNYNNLITLTEL